jgi:hypothetical protein
LEPFPGFEELVKECPDTEAFSLRAERCRIENHFGVPIEAVRQRMCCVNAEAFEGRPAGTLLFIGADTRSRDRWALLLFAYRPQGWGEYHAAADFGPLAALTTSAA